MIVYARGRVRELTNPTHILVIASQIRKNFLAFADRTILARGALDYYRL